MVIAIVMADNKHCFTFRLQLQQDLQIEDFPEHRILVRRPLVENVERAILKKRREKCKAFALTLRKVDGGKRAFLDLHLVVQLKLRQVIPRPIIKLFRIQTEQTLEQIKIVKHSRKELPVLISILIRDRSTVERNLTFLRNVKSAQ